MTDTQWGASLTGAQMKLLLAAGLPDIDVEARDIIGGLKSVEKSSCWNYDATSLTYRIPATHPAYTLLDAGWLDGRNVRLWFGGDKAPNDWEEGSEVLFRNGTVPSPANTWTWEHLGYGGDIIAYIAKDEDCPACKPAPCYCDIMAKDPNAPEPETVTIAKMTEAEARDRIADTDWTEFPVKMHDVLSTLKLFGLIKPEPTREERFWKGKERHSLYHDESARALIDAALEFER